MEYIRKEQGVSLQTWCHSEYAEMHTAANVSRVFDTAWDALTCLHNKGLAHRDIKPANLMVRFAPGKANVVDKVQIIDFGEACAPMGECVAQMGTLMYMHPLYLRLTGFRPGKRMNEKECVWIDQFSMTMTLMYMLIKLGPGNVDMDVIFTQKYDNVFAFQYQIAVMQQFNQWIEVVMGYYQKVTDFWKTRISQQIDVLDKDIAKYLNFTEMKNPQLFQI